MAGLGSADVIGRVLQPYLLNNPERVRMFGPSVPLPPRLAVVLSMILHEIATNAAKYGALSNDTGTVVLDWEIVEESTGRQLRLIWTEAGGPAVTAPVQRGFGSRLIERSARDQLGGEATVDFLPRGVVYTVTCALSAGGYSRRVGAYFTTRNASWRSGGGAERRRSRIARGLAASRSATMASHSSFNSRSEMPLRFMRYWRMATDTKCAVSGSPLLTRAARHCSSVARMEGDRSSELATGVLSDTELAR